jgi:DNA polymerase I-like protein with 3'-5' exonuclease and polymerase domains
VPRFREFKWGSWAEWAYYVFRLDAEVSPTGMTVAIDTETSGVGFYDEPFAATLSWRGLDGSIRNAYFDLDHEVPGRAERVQLLRNILMGMATRWVFHNAKFDLQKLILAGVFTLADIQQKEIHDTQTIYVLLDENGRKGLKHLAATVLKVDDTIEVEIKTGPNKGTFKRVPKEEHHLSAVRRKLKLKKDDGYHLLPREALVPYALKDTDFTLMLYEKLLPELQLQDDRLQELYREFMQLKLVLLDMEADSFKLDIPYLDCITSEYGVKVMEGWERIVKLTGNPDLNPQSPVQITEAFAKRGVKLESTAVDVLRDIDDELAAALLQYRSDKKIHTTYLVTLKKEQRDGYVHPNFNDDAARTGRMSSSAASNN